MRAWRKSAWGIPPARHGIDSLDRSIPSMRTQVLAFLALGILLTSQPITKADEPAKLPKVVLIGDSIRLGYAPTVAKQLEGKAVVVQSKSNGGDSARVLANLTAWAVAEKPD